MKQAVVAVMDRAAQIFSRPFFVAAVGQAIRSFGEEVNRRDEQRGDFAKHPQDFDLYQLAWYTDTDGVFQPEFKLLVRGVDVLTKDQ